jgi:hypothetical protein
VKQAPGYPRKAILINKVSDDKKPGGYSIPNDFRVEFTATLEPNTDDANPDPSSLDRAEPNKIKELPKEVGVMLITAGIVGFILPGPGTPAIIAGGLALWPQAFGKLESWLEHRYPRVHRQGMKQISRFLNDLEERYPYYNHGRGRENRQSRLREASEMQASLTCAGCGGFGFKPVAATPNFPDFS